MRGVRGARDDQVVRKRRLLRLGVLVLQAAVAPAVVAAGVAGAVDSERFSERVSERFSERFSESLLLRPLASDLLMAHLNLSMSGDATASLHLFPGPMVELAVGTGATGISLSHERPMARGVGRDPRTAAAQDAPARHASQSYGGSRMGTCQARARRHSLRLDR